MNAHLAIRLCRLVALSSVVLTTAWPANPAPAADDTSFDTGPALGQRLLQNVVRIDSLDLGEHAFGLVVGTDADHVYIATARHVVARKPPAGLTDPERSSQSIVLGFCALSALAPVQPGEIVTGFDGADDDLALLRTPRPAGYALLARALAPADGAERGEAAWQLGRERECVVAPTPGLLADGPDERHNLRIDLHGVLGGSSGGPVVSGRGIVGITKRSDAERITAHAIADLQSRIQALAGMAFMLQDARNIPPGDPDAASRDLTESLNAYLFGARDLHGLLSQDTLQPPTFIDLVKRYVGAVDRFRAARDKYDGTLKLEWDDDMLAEWSALRDELWDIHLVFFGLNGSAATTIARTGRPPPDVRAQMAALEPRLVKLQDDIKRFAGDLGTKRRSS